MMSIAIFAVMLVWLLILASYVAFRRHRAAHPGEFTGFSVRGGDRLAVVAGLGVLAATAVKVPDMRQAAGIGIAFTLALLACYALTARRRRPWSSGAGIPVGVEVRVEPGMRRQPGPEGRGARSSRVPRPLPCRGPPDVPPALHRTPGAAVGTPHPE
ncbi:hypothetical protein ACOZE3_29170 [Streptomyces cinereoruber]|uniref:hypothetical protein n=1 Tax=Streptomyces cinereoruber TaxID=67260 RepID=UPI003BF5381A